MFYRFQFIAKRKGKASSKNGTRNFQSNSPLEGSVCFYVTVTGDF